MNDQLLRRKMLLRDIEASIVALRSLLATQGQDRERLHEAARAADSLAKTANVAGEDSFERIAYRLLMVLNRYQQEQTTATPVEQEVVELATDWLVQLACLYREKLPEPRALVAELLYTFDLADRFRDAATLVDLLETHGGDDVSRIDPFLDDPEFAVEDRPVVVRTDPFADDPGFGMEFDLLQRTITLSAESGLPIEPTDPFTEDSAFDLNADGTSTGQDLPFDVFASDPPLPGDLED